MNMLDKINGKKTYIVAGLMAATAAVGWATNILSGSQAWELLMQSAGIAGLRHAMDK